MAFPKSTGFHSKKGDGDNAPPPRLHPCVASRGRIGLHAFDELLSQGENALGLGDLCNAKRIGVFPLLLVVHVGPLQYHGTERPLAAAFRVERVFEHRRAHQPDPERLFRRLTGRHGRTPCERTKRQFAVANLLANAPKGDDSAVNSRGCQVATDVESIDRYLPIPWRRRSLLARHATLHMPLKGAILPLLMPAKSSRTIKADPESAEAVAASVDRLAEEVRILRTAIDEIRDEIAWAARNCQSCRSKEHAVVQRMAVDPLAADWNERLQIDRSPVGGDPPTTVTESTTLDHLVERIAGTCEAVAEGQLECVLTFLGGMRRQILEALGKSSDVEIPTNGQSPSPPRAIPAPSETANDGNTHSKRQSLLF